MALAGFAATGHAVTVGNLLADAGFEAIAGNEPDAGTAPWFTSGEAQNGSFVSATNRFHGGGKSAKFAFYYDDGAIVQNTGVQIVAGKDYEISMWVLLPSDEASANAAHTNDPTITMSLYTSTTANGSYSYKKGFFGNQPTVEDAWQKFTGIFTASDLAGWVSQYMQIRYIKDNANTTHKFYIDDTAFGESSPVLPGRLISWDTSSGSGSDYSQTSVTGTLWTGKLYAVDATAGSTDGTFGNADGGAATNPTAYAVRTATPNGTDTVGFRIINNTGASIQLDSISFDYSRWTANAPQQVSLRYTWGDLDMAGDTFINSTNGIPVVSKVGNYTDFDWSLEGIGDRILKDGEQANFALTATNAAGTSSSGAFDNIAIFGRAAEPRTETFHLDAANGSDFNSGLSSNQAWQTFARLNLETFGPGARILFKRGDVFTGRWVFKGSGTPSDPIIVGAYGTGAKPLLQGGTSNREVIYITDSRGFEIRDLKISNYYPSENIWERYGINLEPPINAGDLEHIYFDNLDLVDIVGSSTNTQNESRGIWANTDTTDDAPILSRWNDFRIENCRFENIDGRAAQVRDGCNTIGDVKLKGITNYYPSIGFVFQNNTGKNCHYNLLQFNGTKDALVQYNYMDGTVDGSAVWPFATDGSLFQFNEYRHIHGFPGEAYGLHFDYNCIGTVMQYNHVYDAQGGMVLVLNNSVGSNFQENAVARYNVGIDVGWRENSNVGAIRLNGSATGTKVYNNTFVTLDTHSHYSAITCGNWGDGIGNDWPTNALIANNVFCAVGNPSGYSNETYLAMLGNVVTHNLYFGNIVPPAQDLNPFTGDPKFANPSGTNAADFKVTYGSAAIGQGMPIAGNGGRDYFDDPVSPTNAPTIGFHEYQTDATIDTDSDGMPDLWESTYGLSPANAADSGLDGDGDKQSNLAEYIADTNPNDIASLFLATLQPSAQQLYWNASPDRLYTILHSPDLQSWETVESNVASPYSIDMSGLKGFYKIQVELPQPQ